MNEWMNERMIISVDEALECNTKLLEANVQNEIF